MFPTKKPTNPRPRTKSMRSVSRDVDEYKYQIIFEGLKEGILAGKYAAGARLPSELDLVRRFSVCRVTAAKAIKKLQQ